MDKVFSKLPRSVYSILDRTLQDAVVNKPSRLSIDEASLLLSCATHSDCVSAIALTANICREHAKCGDHVTYVVNRNINFTNACIKKCGFCAFSRTGIDQEAYFLPLEEIIRRAKEAAEYGATEVCIQAGLPPNMSPSLYETIAREIKKELPHIHLHAFSPEEIIYNASRNKCSIKDMIQRLKDAGTDSTRCCFVLHLQWHLPLVFLCTTIYIINIYYLPIVFTHNIVNV
jgi:FO synthase subunit 2